MHDLRPLRRCFLISACAAIASASAGSALAQSSRPIKFVVPTSPGSSADIGARTVGERVQKILGRIVITENKVGAGGSLAAASVAASEPNGEVIGIQGNSYLLFAVEFPQQKFDPMLDVVPVAMISRGTNVLLVSANSPYTRLQDIVQRAKAEPGRLAYASAGIGSSTYHSAERIRLAAGLDMIHVPYKGSPEAVQEVIAGRVDFAFAPVSVAAPFVQGGRVRALAVSSSKRTTALPQIPTTVEAGVPGSSYESWLVALVSVKTPVVLQAEYNKAFNLALETPEVRSRFTALGVEPDPMSLAELKAFVSQEHASAVAYAKSAR